MISSSFLSVLNESQINETEDLLSKWKDILENNNDSSSESSTTEEVPNQDVPLNWQDDFSLNDPACPDSYNRTEQAGSEKSATVSDDEVPVISHFSMAPTTTTRPLVLHYSDSVKSINSSL